MENIIIGENLTSMADCVRERMYQEMRKPYSTLAAKEQSGLEYSVEDVEKLSNSFKQVCMCFCDRMFKRKITRDNKKFVKFYQYMDSPSPNRNYAGTSFYPGTIEYFVAFADGKDLAKYGERLKTALAKQINEYKEIGISEDPEELKQLKELNVCLEFLYNQSKKYMAKDNEISK